MRRNPDDHKGEVILLGGEIVGLTPMPNVQVQIECGVNPLYPEGTFGHRREKSLLSLPYTTAPGRRLLESVDR